MAPVTIFVAAMVVFAVIPFGSVIPPDVFPASWGITEPIRLVVAPGVDVGMIYVFAVGSIAVYGVVLGGWASNNKYSFLGGMRSSAQLISYELPLGLGILGVVLVTGSLRLDEIIRQQAASGVWNVFSAAAGLRGLLRGRLCRGRPAALRPARGRAGTGRRLSYRIFRHQADDVPGGRVPAHDHGGIPDRDPVPRRLAFLGPDRHRATPSTWPVAVLRVIVLLAKVMGVILFFMLARWSWPRFRFDQLMDIGLEGDDSLGVGEPGGGGGVDGIRRSCWRGCWALPSAGMAAVGWACCCWLAGDHRVRPTGSGNRPRRRPDSCGAELRQ